MVANPIFINTFVVFVRLYWFEKRFQHVVREARNFKRTRSRSRTNTQAIDEKDIGGKEQGVNGRNIVVLREDGNPIGPNRLSPFLERPKKDPRIVPSSDSSDAQKQSSESSNEDSDLPPLDLSSQKLTSFHRNITFADELERSPSTPMDRLPQKMSAEQHIAFLENQRNPKDKGTLRIPGPRDFDRGDVPQTLNDEGHSDLEGTRSIDQNDLAKHDTDQEDGEAPNGGDRAVKRNITIDESNPKHPRLNKMPSHLSRLTFRKTGTTQSKTTSPFHKTPTSLGRMRSRAGSFSSVRPTTTRDKEPMPYLSWQPTIGRNSAFIDLTEEQREELGGIEYRSLKTLAVLLVCRFLAS